MISGGDMPKAVTAGSSRRRETIVLLVLLSGPFMVVLDFFIVMVALPSMRRDFAASGADLQLVVSCYGVANAAALITGGRLGDMFGLQRMFVVGLALFTLASAACGAASSMPMLVAARALQGLAGALMQPQVLAMIGLLYTGASRVQGFSAYALTMGLAGVLAQLIGGMLIQADIAGLGWRACFLINVPVGLLALGMMTRVALPVAARAGNRLDLKGLLLVAATLTLVIWPLVEGRERGWPWWSLCALATAVPFVAACWLHQRRLSLCGGQPLLAPELLLVRPFATGLAITLLFHGGLASFYFVLAVHLQNGLGLDALSSGLAFTVLALGFFTTSMWAPSI
jgi:MFS family permease